MSRPEVQGFPVGFETKIILSNVRCNDRVIYLKSCACMPLYHELLKVIPKENIRTTKGVHESINIEDDWASLLIGQCILDELSDISKATSEISRVLRTDGTAILSGPTSRADRLRFETPGKAPREFLPLREIGEELSQKGLIVSQTHNLTEEVKIELRNAGRSTSILDFETSMDYVLIKATKISAVSQ